MTERWTDERLDKFAETVERDHVALDRKFAGMVQAMTALAETQVQILQRIDVTQSQVKGLQTEMRHIWGHLFGEENTP